MKIYFLIPPSEWKNHLNYHDKKSLSFLFDKPLEIAKNVTEKDLKCSWKRYEEWLFLNKNILKWETSKAIDRYDGVMYNAIDYKNMSENWKKFFEDNFLIFSWMYGVLKPLDIIGNYKLPIETKWLLRFWWDKISSFLNTLEADVFVDFLPDSYKKMINKKVLNKKIIEVVFLDKKTWKKLTHNSKKIKWEFIKKICETWVFEMTKDYLESWVIKIVC